MLLDQFKNYLTSIGVVHYNINSEMIHFKKNELDYVFQVDDRDTPYFRLVLPNVLDVNDDNINQLREFMSRMNANYKVGKLIEVENSVWIAAEMFAYSPIGLNSLFERLIQLLEQIHNNISIEVPRLNLINNEEK